MGTVTECHLFVVRFPVVQYEEDLILNFTVFL